MKLVTFLIFSVYLVASLLISFNETFGQDDTLTYENLFPLRLTLEYPLDWVYVEHIELGYNEIQFIPAEEAMTNEEYVPLLSIKKIMDAPYNNMPLPMAINYTLDSIEQWASDVKILQTNETSIGGFPAQMILTQNTVSSNETIPEFKSLSVPIVKAPDLYLAVYSAPLTEFDKYEGEARRMIESIKFMP